MKQLILAIALLHQCDSVAKKYLNQYYLPTQIDIARIIIKR